jgi:hypothetical protein
MKIRKLHIKNYKVFDDIELDFTDANGNILDKIVLDTPSVFPIKST